MENANSYEYLEKIKIAVIENLKKTAPVPSVQMQDVPRQGMGTSDDQEDEMDDVDEDENKDVRMTQRQWEKKVQRQDDFEDSDDEDMAEANGVYKTNGLTRKSILDYRNPTVVDDDMEIDSRAGTPVPKATEAAADNEDTILEDVEAQRTPAEAEVVADPAPATEADTSKTDGDGDVDMGDAGEKPAETAIKTEEVDGATISQSARKKSPAANTSDSTGNDEAVKSKDASPSPAGDDSKDADGAAMTKEQAEKADATASGVSAKSDSGEAQSA